MLERCAAAPCNRDYDVWAYSPRAGGIVPTCVAHHMDVVAGAVRLKENITIKGGAMCR